MPRECLAYVKFKDGHAHIGVYRLEGKAPFGYNEMKKWIMRDDPEVVEVSVSKVSPHLKDALQAMLDAKENGSE